MSNYSTQVIADWLNKLLQGDLAGLDSLLIHVQDRLRRIARNAKSRLSAEQKNAYETDDLMQDMHLRLLTRWESLAVSLRAVPEGDRVRFFFGCTARIIRDLICEQSRRTAARRVRAATAQQPDEPGFEHGENAGAIPIPLDHSNVPDRIAMWAEFHEFLGALPESLQQVTDLYWYHGFTHAEVGKALGIAEVTSRARWAQVRHQAIRKFPETPFDWQPG